MAKKMPRISIPSSFFNLEDQYHLLLEDQYPKLIFDLEDQYLLLLEDQYPKSILKRPRWNSGQRGVKQWSKQCVSHGVGQSGCTGSAEHNGTHRGHRGERTVHVLPIFFAFHAFHVLGPMELYQQTPLVISIHFLSFSMNISCTRVNESSRKVKILLFLLSPWLFVENPIFFHPLFMCPGQWKLKKCAWFFWISLYQNLWRFV